MKNIVAIIVLLILIITNPLYGQEHEALENDHGAEHQEFKRHSVLLEFGYTHIPDGFEEVEGDQVIWVPTFGLAYGYHFNHKWGVGLTVNLETAKYLIKFNDEDLTRENVLIIAAVATYELLPNWGVFVGPGIEIEQHHNFAVFRFGTEYIFPLKKNWIITPILTFDHKVEYTSWELSVGIGKRF